MKESGNSEFAVNDYKRLSRQNNLLFTAGAVSVLAGLFFPKVPALVDLLIIFSLTLSAAVLVICLRDNKPTELAGLPLLAVTALSALLTVTIASAKLLIIEGTAGLIITHLARLYIITDTLPTLPGATVFTAASIVLLTFAAKSISRLLLNSKTRLDEISAAEQSDGEFNSVTDEDEQENLAAKEKGLLYATHAFGRLAVWLCVLISAVIMLSLFSVVITDKMLTGLAVGAIIVFQLPAFFVVFAVSRLTCKITLESSQQNRMTEEQFQQRIKVVAREVAAIQTDNHLHHSSSEELLHNTHYGDAAGDRLLFGCNEFENEASYDSLTNLLTESDAGKVLLMAACGSQHAPVTIPVNTAVRLAARGLKTLIIDFDLKRSSVQRVFETAGCDVRAVKTCVENISLISGKRLASAKPQMLQQLFTKAEKLYDYILVYAPDAALPRQISEYFTIAMFLGTENAVINPLLAHLIEELSTTTCQILTPRHLLQPA